MSDNDRLRQPGYADFELTVSPGRRRTYPMRVSSPAGDLQTTMRFPFTDAALENQLLAVENVLLRSGRTRRLAPSTEQRTVQDFGEALFNALLPDDARSLYYQSRREAELQGKGLRLKLRIEPPQLAALPWEFLFDARQADYVGLSTATPIVRDVGLPQPIEPLRIAPPLRILGLVASPSGLAPLDVTHEQQRVAEALKGLQAAGLITLKWLEGQTWRALQQEIRRHEFHVLHFIGHGGFDRTADEGLIMLADDAGDAYSLPATRLAMLLADEPALRLVVLNSCNGAQGGRRDVFSSTASILLRRGVPAVLAMQYEITDETAIELARSFYEALADGVPVDAAVAEARKAVRLAIPGTVEWATPVLYQRAPDGVLFDIERTPLVEPPPAATRSEPSGQAESVAPPGETATAAIAAAPEAAQTTSGADGKQSLWNQIKANWSTLPDLLKQAAALITAVGTLLSVLYGAGIIGADSDPTPTPAAPPTATLVAPTPTVAAPTPTVPPPVMRGELVEPRIEGKVTLGEGCQERGWSCAKWNEDQYPAEGYLINVKARILGYAGRQAEVRWTMFDARTGEPVAGFQDQPGWPKGVINIDSPDDEVHADLWVPVPMRDGDIFVRLTLMNDVDTELDSIDTESLDGMP